MNFLSHYYLDRSETDSIFNVGLIMPDIISLHNRGARVSEKSILKSLEHISDQKGYSLASGMLLHLRLDKWFHSGMHFKTGTTMIRDIFKEHFKADISHFHSHILFEILIDRNLQLENESLTDDFMSEVFDFDYELVIDNYGHLRNFDRDKFISFFQQFRNSTFLYDYLSLHKIKELLERISRRVSTYNVEWSTDDNENHEFYRRVDDELRLIAKEVIIEAEKLDFKAKREE